MFLKKLCIGAMAVLLAFPAYAGTGDDLFALPELRRGFDLTAYAAQTDTITKSFPDIPDAGFEVSLPKTWLERMALGQGFGEIARFDGPAFGDVRPYFSYRRQAVPRENSAKMELIAYLLKQGYVLRSINEIDARNVEALYVATMPNGDSYVVRTRMRIMGPNALLAEYALPAQVWERARDEQTFAINSFKFAQNSDAEIEKKIERSYFESLRYFYPASWIFEGQSTPADNIVTESFLARDEKGQEAGRMKLSVFGARSLKDAADKRDYSVEVPALLRDMRGAYEKSGYELGAAMETRKPDLNLPTGFSVMDVYELRRRVSQYETDRKGPVTHELWVAVFQSNDFHAKTYVAELFTPSREQDMYLWSVNVRSFEIVLKSLQ